MRAALAREGLHASCEWGEQLEAFGAAAGLSLAWARQQYAAADLRDMGDSPLPDLCAHESLALAGPVCVQFDEMREVARPKAQSSGVVAMAALPGGNNNNLMGLRRDEDEDEDGDVSARGGRRMLKLKCTDGKQDVYAFEYRPMGSVLENLQPGCKMVLRNVRVLHGLVALQPGCVTVLEGSLPQTVAAAMDDDDDDDIDLAAIEALERAALQQRRAAAPPPPQPANAVKTEPKVKTEPVQSAAPAHSVAPAAQQEQVVVKREKKKVRKRRFLEDDSD